MLFDLRGKRRRGVQAIYLTLALLMGGGLVFFGIGGDVSGGLFDAFSERGGGANDQVEKRIERNEERLAARPGSERALKELVRDYYSLATGLSETGTEQFSEDAADELQRAASYWQRYLRAEDKKPDASLASVALQIYDVRALNEPEQAQEAMSIIAEASNDPNSYIQLVTYATAAGDTRTADLAAQKALSLSPEENRKAVRKLIKDARQPQAIGG